MESPVASGSRHATFPPSSSSSAARKREEDIVYLFEAEEERITNLLSRKLERLKEEKVELENLLEAENESHVNRLTREISALRAMNAQQSGGAVDENGTSSTQAQANGNGAAAFPLSQPNVMLDAMRRENEELRSRLVTAEQGYVRLSRLNDVYREELIELRRRLGLPIDNLIGLPSTDVYSQPTHLRQTSSATRVSTSDDATQTQNATSAAPRPQLSGLPIPITRAPSTQTHHAVTQQSYSSSTTPNTNSPSSSLHSPFPFSPTTSVRINGAASGTTTSSSSSAPVGEMSPPTLGPSSYLTQITTPPSSTSPLLHIGDATPFAHQLSYPSVPPPSLSSSLGSPVYSRRNSFGQNNRRTSMDRGTARVAETGSLRNRRASAAGAGIGLSTETVEESPPGSTPSSVIGVGDS